MNLKLIVAIHPRHDHQGIDYVELDEQALLEAASRKSRYLFGDQGKQQLMRLELRTAGETVVIDRAARSTLPT